MSAPLAVFAVLTGALAGLSLGLLGVGSSILVVPILVYGLHVGPHQAIGTSTVAAAVSALWSLTVHARGGTVRWRHGAAYALSSVLGAASGARLGKITDSHLLLALLGILMMGVAGLMLRSLFGARAVQHAHEPHRRRRVVPLLAAAGFGVGTLAGLVGVGGGFLTVPALMFIAGMPLLNAVGSSLLSVTAVAATTGASYASAHLVDWRIAGLLVLGSLLGGYLGVRLARVLGARRRALTVLFCALVTVTGLYMVIRGLVSLR